MRAIAILSCGHLLTAKDCPETLGPFYQSPASCSKCGGQDTFDESVHDEEYRLVKEWRTQACTN